MQLHKLNSSKVLFLNKSLTQPDLSFFSAFDYYYQWPCNYQFDYYDYCPYQIFPDCCEDDCAVQCYPNYPVDPVEPIGISQFTHQNIKVLKS